MDNVCKVVDNVDKNKFMKILRYLKINLYNKNGR